MSDAPATAPSPAVSMRHITRRFGPVVANDDVSLDLAPGEIHGLVGENGAGKSTLMRVLYGLLQPDAGTIEVGGRAVRVPSPAAAMRLGLGMVHQHFMLVGPLTVAENVTLGREPAGPLGGYRRAEAERAVAELAARHGLPVDPRARVETLSVGAQQRVEILKALHRGARVLILDEPTAVLTPQEVDDLFRVLRDLQARGTGVVLITHKLAEVAALARRVTVMRAGRVVGGGPAADFPVGRMAELMVGRAIPELRPRSPRGERVPLLRVRMLDVLDDRDLPAVRRVSFDVHAGEIVGIAGVEGNGQHELVECLAGLRRAAHGEIAVADRDVTALGARGRAAAGLAHIPSDRLRRGLVPEMTLAENLALGRQREPAVDGAVAQARQRIGDETQTFPAIQLFRPEIRRVAVHMREILRMRIAAQHLLDFARALRSRGHAGGSGPGGAGDHHSHDGLPERLCATLSRGGRAREGTQPVRVRPSPGIASASTTVPTKTRGA